MSPRAIAVLVALRQGLRTAIDLRNAIADETGQDVTPLLRDMAGWGLVRTYDATRWGLDEDGLAWLQANDLDASEEAKAAMHAVSVPVGAP